MKWYFISPIILQKLIWIPTRFILFLCGDLTVHGLENLASLHGAVIFACNHTSEIDPLFIPASLPFFSRFSPIFFTSREKDFYKNSGWRQIFYGGTLFKAWGAYPVYVGLHDYEKSTANQQMILGHGGSLCVYPEGGITKTGEIGPAKGGIGYLAYVTKAPIVPVRLQGAYRMSFLDFVLRRRKLSISFGQPMRIMDKANTTLSIDDFKMYANHVMDRVRNLEPMADVGAVGQQVKTGTA